MISDTINETTERPQVEEVRAHKMLQKSENRPE